MFCRAHLQQAASQQAERLRSAVPVVEVLSLMHHLQIPSRGLFLHRMATVEAAPLLLFILLPERLLLHHSFLQNHPVVVRTQVLLQARRPMVLKLRWQTVLSRLCFVPAVLLILFPMTIIHCQEQDVPDASLA